MNSLQRRRNDRIQVIQRNGSPLRGILIGWRSIGRALAKKGQLPGKNQQVLKARQVPVEEPKSREAYFAGDTKHKEGLP